MCYAEKKMHAFLLGNGAISFSALLACIRKGKTILKIMRVKILASEEKEALYKRT